MTTAEERELLDTLGPTFPEIPPNLDPLAFKFLGDPEGKRTGWFERCWLPGSLAIGFGIGSCVTNLASKLPVRAGIHKHILYMVGAGILGEGLWRMKTKLESERDLQYFHYMVLHPEDFSAPPRKKFAEVIQPWVPCR